MSGRERITELVTKLHAEIEREREANPEALAEWYQGMLEAERRKGEQRVPFIEMLRSAHGLGPEEGDGGPPAAA